MQEACERMRHRAGACSRVARAPRTPQSTPAPFAATMIVSTGDPSPSPLLRYLSGKPALRSVGSAGGRNVRRPGGGGGT